MQGKGTPRSSHESGSDTVWGLFRHNVETYDVKL
jgi:hypothetical protein